jgi:hypothetical protein
MLGGVVKPWGREGIGHGELINQGI